MHSDKGSGVTIEPACDGSPQRERHTHWNARVCTTRFHKPAFIVCGNISHRTTSLSTVDFDAQSACRPLFHMPSITEADTCRKFVLPKLYNAGWTDDQINEQRTFTDGRIVVVGSKVTRRPQKRADYVLRYTRDFPIAVVEAKASFKKPGDGLQQAKEYADILGLKFAYSTNGHGIVEHDLQTGQESDAEAFPSPEDLWKRLRTQEGMARGWQPAPHAVLPPFRQIASLLSGNSHQPSGAIRPSGQSPGASHHGDGHRQDYRGVPGLLEALEFPLE